jgi:hypothetical protein
MPLQGSLKDFGVVELLQMLSSQEKTGCLRVHGEAGRQALVFETGKIVSTWDPQATNRDPFREFLLRREIVPREHVARVLKTEITTPHPFGEMLLRMRVLTHDEVQTAFSDHVQEKVDELFRWRGGSFEFIQQDTVAPCALEVAVQTEGLLMEAARRADEVGTTRVRLESVLDRRIGRVHASDHESLSDNAERLFRVIDGRSSIEDLAKRHEMIRGDAVIAAAELVRAGHASVLEATATLSAGAAEAAEPAAIPKVPAVAHAVGLVIVVGLALVASRWFAPAPRTEPPTNPVHALAARVESIGRDRDLAALRCALEFFRHQHRRYPAQLEALVSDGMIDRKALDTAAQLDLIYYTVDGGLGYRLESRDESKIVRRAPAR